MRQGDFHVVTCLGCGKREMFEIRSGLGKFVQRRLDEGCKCGSKEHTTYSNSNYIQVKKLSEAPLHPAIKLAYEIIALKRKAIKTMSELVDSCEVQIVKADIDNTQLKKLSGALGALRTVGAWTNGDH